MPYWYSSLGDLGGTGKAWTKSWTWLTFFMVYDNGFLVCTVVSLSPTRRDGAQTQEYTSLQTVSDEEKETHVLPVLCEDVAKAIGSVRN